MGKKIKQVKINTDKTVKKITEKYKGNVEKGVEKASKDLDKLLDELDKYYGKRGNVLKSKIRSNKSRKRYNELLKEINQTYGSKKKRTAKTKEVQTAETSDKIANYFGMTGAHAKEAADIFVNYTLPMIPGFSVSEAVLALADSGMDAMSIKYIMIYLDKEVNYRTPDEMKVYRTEDDLSMFVSHLSNLFELDKDIPIADLIKMSEQMVLYDLDNYDEIIKEYYEDTESFWNKDEEDDEDE